MSGGADPGLHALALALTLSAVVRCVVSVLWEGAATPPFPGGVPQWWPGFVPAPGF